MKFIIATSVLVVLVLSAWTSSIARASKDEKTLISRFKSPNDCSAYNYETRDVCRNCCNYFNLATSAGRRSLLFPSEHLCKCITREEAIEREEKRVEESIKREKAMSPRFKSPKDCSGYLYDNNGACRKCCHHFDMTTSEGKRSSLQPREHLCECVATRE